MPSDFSRRFIMKMGSSLGVITAIAGRAVPATAALDLPWQPYWRYCIKCNVLFFDGFPNFKGVCPRDGRGHETLGFNFEIYYHQTINVPDTPNSQSGWRYCGKCAAMFFNLFDDRGRCPVGGEHQPSGWHFVLEHDLPPTDTLQDRWRYCWKCKSLFFNGFETKGFCPAGGPHEASGFNFDLMHHSP
jgi:hypothetical protein